MRNDPRIIKAKFNSKCAETGETIKKGDDCLYYPQGKKAYSLQSKQYGEYLSWQADLAMGYDY